MNTIRKQEFSKAVTTAGEIKEPTSSEKEKIMHEGASYEIKLSPDEKKVLNKLEIEYMENLKEKTLKTEDKDAKKESEETVKKEMKEIPVNPVLNTNVPKPKAVPNIKSIQTVSNFSIVEI